MNRRSFLTSILAAGMAPAVVRAESLMRVVVPKLWVPDGLAYTTGDILMFAFDKTTRSLWYGKNGTWLNQPEPKPYFYWEARPEGPGRLVLPPTDLIHPDFT